MSRNTQELSWRRATKCSGGTCVEVARSGDKVLVRDSKSPEAVQEYTSAEWSAFTAAVKSGEFDFT
ncbi:DUF397 domain-containing protein [Actinoplanes sp. NPDC049596]|uniref:DUF397 domain-containing protein n=1 Tax=unclassified Actinoplanes TaxID=2626549 RepID=UPI003434EE38